MRPQGQNSRKMSTFAAVTFILATLVIHAQAQPALGATSQLPDAVNSTAAPRVIIVGAGLAGISAARDLVDAEIKDVTVLEARSRPGGRLYSVNTTAGPVDLGAMWIHEASPSNPLYKLAKQDLQVPMSPVVLYNAGQLFGPDGKPLNLGFYAATYISWTNQLLSNITRLRALEAAAANSSSSSSSSSNGLPPFWQAPKDIPFSQLYSDWIASNSKTWQPEQVQAANAIMTINVQNLLNGNVTRVSTLRYGDAKTLPAIDVHLKDGFDAVPIKLLPGLNVNYNTFVTNISQEGDVVTVTTGNGTQLTADYAIVTVPLGVLKQESIGFQPTLPAEKQAAIKDMGMGVLDKVVLVFKPEDVFWGKNVDFVIMTTDDWRGRWTSWLSYYRLLGMPVLVGLNAADTALDIEALSDEQAVAEAMQVLSRAFSKNNATLPTPVETHVTRWGNDPLARGAYSYYANGNPKNITDMLASPHGRVLFAGEATSTKMATALGALLSGRREAARIINMTAAQ